LTQAASRSTGAGVTTEKHRPASSPRAHSLDGSSSALQVKVRGCERYDRGCRAQARDACHRSSANRKIPRRVRARCNRLIHLIFSADGLVLMKSNHGRDSGSCARWTFDCSSSALNMGRRRPCEDTVEAMCGRRPSRRGVDRNKDGRKRVATRAGGVDRN
jgi:hypothetical protein